jgi:hypothetical protein
MAQILKYVAAAPATANPLVTLRIYTCWTEH